MKKVGDHWFSDSTAKQYQALLDDPRWKSFCTLLADKNREFAIASLDLRSTFEFWQTQGFSRYDIYRNHQFIDKQAVLDRIGAERAFMEKVRFEYLKPFMERVLPAPILMAPDGSFQVL